MYGMFELYIERKNEEITTLANVHGIDLENKDGNRQENSTINNGPTKPKGQALPIFGSTDQYAHLSDEERKNLTQEMMGHHKAWQRGDQDAVLGS